MINVTLETVLDAYGTEQQNPATGEFIRTGLWALTKMDLPDAKLKHNLGMLKRRLKPHVRKFEEDREDALNDATEIAKDKDGNPIKSPNAQGAMVEQYILPRAARLLVEKEMREKFQTKVEVDREIIVWPKMNDPGDREKKRQIVPCADDIARTADFIDYSGVCGE